LWPSQAMTENLVINRGSDPINWFNSTTLLWLSQAMTENLVINRGSDPINWFNSATLLCLVSQVIN
jgi:hypothetical protein